MPNWAVPPLPMRITDSDQPVFVGRQSELERLERIWEAVERGERQAVFLGGEPGSGKSRIAAELARGLTKRDVAVLWGSSSPDLSHPYEPLVGALNQLLQGTEPGSLAGIIPDDASELLRLTPHLRLHDRGLEEPPPDQQEYRHELFAAYVALLRALARDRPVALILEDMHWSSAPTRRLMTYVIENTGDLPLLVLATMRNTAPDRSDDLSYAIADLYRLPGVTRLDLPGLEVDDVERYLTVEIGHAEPHVREAAALLRDQTGGNPFYLREMWRELAAGGGLGAIREKAFSAPRSIRDTLGQRLKTFTPLGRTVLEYAAVLGDVFDVSDIFEAADEASGDVLDALGTAAETGLVTAAGAGTYVFQHALIRQALLDGLSPSRSAQTHATLARSIEPGHETDATLAPLLARLFEGARALGYRDEIVYYLAEAAELARHGLAHEEAAVLWERAARTATGDKARSEDLLLSAARSHILAGDFPEARRIYREVNGSEDPRTAVRAAIGFEDASWRPGMLGHDARALLETSIDRIDADPSDPLYIGALTALGRANTFSGDLDASDRIGRDALRMSRELGDDTLVADALVATLLRVATVPDIDDETYGLSIELRDIVMRSGDYDRLGPAGAMKASTGYLDSDRKTYREGWHDVRLAATKTGQPFWSWVDGCYQFCDEYMSGSFGRAAATASRINELGYSFGAEEAEGPYGLQMYLVRRETGALDAVAPFITGDPARDGTWTPGLVSLYCELGMRESARAVLPEALELVFTTTNQMAVYPAVLTFAVEAGLYLEDLEVIDRLMPSMAVFDGRNLLVGQGVAPLGSGNTFLGRMHRARGDHDAADTHFRKALQSDVAIGSIAHQALTLAHFANLADDAGDTERAVDYRSRARQLATPIGQQRALRLLDPGDTGLPDGLTPRELEVLTLLVEGRSNKEIGERLYISANTAANHVRSILTKTGSPNRTAAAIYATERELV